MKNFISVGALLFGLTAVGGDFMCKLLEGGQFPQEKRAAIDPSNKEGVVLRFESPVVKNLKIEGRYSPILNSTDAEIMDLITNYKALSTDWGNSKEENSSASLVLKMPEGANFIFQCVRYH